MRKPNPELERKAKLLKEYLNECWGVDISKSNMWHVEAHPSTYGTVYTCHHPEYDWADKVYMENAEGHLSEVGLPLSKRDPSMIAYLFVSHEKRDTFWDHLLIEYWIKTRDIDLQRKYHWELHEVERKGHSFTYIRPFIGDTNFVTFRCFHLEIERYFIHFDDGDVTVTRNPVWSNDDQSQKRHGFCEVPTLEHVVKLLIEE